MRFFKGARFFFKSIKFRLTLWYLIVIVVLLGMFGGAAYFMLFRSLYQNLDDGLVNRATELQATLQLPTRTIIVEQLNELVQIYDSSGGLLQSFGPNVQITNIGSLVNQALGGSNSFMTSTTSDGQRVRLYATSFVAGPFGRFALVVGRPLAEIASALAAFRYILGFAALTAIILAGVGGALLANRALKPVDRITRAAQDIGESDLSRRINVTSADELGRLAATLNGMIERLETAFERQRQFTADASHELRTPLAVIEAESTLALSKERPEAEYRKSLELVAQETTYMSAIIGKLLFLARNDSGKEPLKLEEVNLKELITELSANAEVLARDKGLQFSLGIVDEVTVKADRVKLRELFLNILENAVRYTPDGGSISASLIRNDSVAIVAIRDTGIGIAPEDLPHIFERFYRVDKARSRAEGGAGLGLAIAKAIAEAHGGKIDVESQPGKGSTFRIVLPLNRRPSALGQEPV